MVLQHWITGPIYVRSWILDGTHAHATCIIASATHEEATPIALCPSSRHMDGWMVRQIKLEL